MPPIEPLSRRQLLAGLGVGAASLALPVVAEAKPRKPRTRALAFTDEVGMREYSLVVGPPPSFTPPLGAGIRASATNVGYFPAFGALTTYNPGGSPPTGWAWDADALVSTTGGASLNLAQVNGQVVANDAGGATITKCVINCPANGIYGVTLNGTGNGTLTVEDTTVVGSLGGANPQNNGISSDDGLVVRRCHITDTGDGIHFVSKTGTLISQCYIGDLRFTDEGQHCDGAQQFQEDVDGSFTFEHSYVYYTTSTIGTPMNAALTVGPASATGTLITPTIDNNFFEGGLYHLRLNFQVRNAVVTDNDFGPLHAGEFGLISTEAGITFTTWSNNRDANGDPIAQP